jgi:predicted signal transduction protein with EAL and GGDEF domain
MVVGMPPQAAAASDSDSASLLAISTLGAIGFLVFAALAFGAFMLLRRTRRATNEVRRLNALLDVLDEGVAVCSGMQAVAVNTSLCRLIGIEAQDAQHLMISSFIADSDAIDRLLGEGELRLDTDITNRAGDAISVEIAARTIPHGDGTARLLEFRDVGERKHTQARVSFLAHHDPLTSLPNRELMRTRLTEAVEKAGRSRQVLRGDLDRPRPLQGHQRHPRPRGRRQDPAYRGGETQIRDAGPYADCTARRRRVRRLVRGHHRRGGSAPDRPAIAPPAQPSDGAWREILDGRGLDRRRVYPEDADNAEDLLKNADLALYHAKAEGRGRARHYTEALGNERQRRMVLGGQLRGAIENGDILAYFQPLIGARDMRVVGFETLARWFHPEFGAIPPPEFVKLAEENGLITQLTDLMMRRAIETAQRWPNNVRVSVNVSPVQINSELVDQVRNIIKTSGLDPKRLELEVTEDVLIKDFDQTASMFSRLRALGVQVAMDDFGAGFTSLGNLRRLNFDRLKIDRIFTMELPSHRRAAAIVRSMFVLARELDLQVTVEGVETYEQFDFLRTEGHCELQGFLFSPPKPASAWADPVSLQFAEPAPRNLEPVTPGAAIPLVARQARRAS